MFSGQYFLSLVGKSALEVEYYGKMFGKNKVRIKEAGSP